MSERIFHLYLCQFSDGWIKAGISASICLRVASLRNVIGKKHGEITCFAASAALGVIARQMERSLLKRLSEKASGQHKRELFCGLEWSAALEEFKKFPVDILDLRDKNQGSSLTYKKTFPDFESRNFELLANTK